MGKTAKRSLSYSEKLKDPRWQKMRLEVLERDKWVCSHCGDDTTTLHVHHGYYEWGLEPWEYSTYSLSSLCEDCHSHAEWLRGWTKKWLGWQTLAYQESLHKLLLGLNFTFPNEGEAIDVIAKIVLGINKGDHAAARVAFEELLVLTSHMSYIHQA